MAPATALSYNLPSAASSPSAMIPTLDRASIAKRKGAVRCLLIEDEPETAHYIVNGLKDAGISVTHAGDGDTGLSLAMQGGWDAIILDRLLPGTRDGLSALIDLRRNGNQTPVVVLSALASLDERVRGLQDGADDYLAKPFALEELLARLQAVLRRSQARDDAISLEMADLRLDLRTRKVTRGDSVIALQPREFRLLEYLVRHRDQVVTRSMLLEAVWDVQVDPQVIDVQISRLRTKIDRGFTPTLIHTLRGVGYMARIES
jgi:two-component system OmpR family response regulator